MFDAVAVVARPAGAAVVLGRCRRRVLLCDIGRAAQDASRQVQFAVVAAAEGAMVALAINTDLLKKTSIEDLAPGFAAMHATLSPLWALLWVLGVDGYSSLSFSIRIFQFAGCTATGPCGILGYAPEPCHFLAEDNCREPRHPCVDGRQRELSSYGRRHGAGLYGDDAIRRCGTLLESSGRAQDLPLCSHVRHRGYFHRAGVRRAVAGSLSR